MIAFLRDLVVKDFWLKLFSFGLAGLIWFTVNMVRSSDSPVPSFASSAPEERVIPSVPVVIMSSAEDPRSFQVNPSTAEVTVQGEPKLLQDLKQRDVRAIVDLTGVGSVQSLKKRIEVSTPRGVTYVRVFPDEVTVSSK